jgi:acyl-coenzyme A thioesterase PaaI-like protein
MKVTPTRLRRVLNIWPPFLFSGIRVEAIADDWRYARVRLKLRWYNRNYVKTQFGGALFAMVDPFWMILTLEALRHEYIVWDKAGEIEFVAPGREMLEEIYAATANGEKYLRWCETEIRSEAGELIARVRKQLYVRRKREAGSAVV